MSEKNTSEIRDAFIRQRRNLMLISVALLLVIGAGFRPEKINILGNTITVDNPDYIIYGIWMLWSYWFIRYIQHYNDLKDTEWRQRYSEELNFRIQRWAEPLALKLRAGIDLEDKHISKFLGQPEYKPKGYGAPPWSYQLNNSKIRRDENDQLEVMVQLESFDAGGGKHNNVPIFVPVGRLRFVLCSILSHSKIVRSTRLFSEYTFPFLVAFAPLWFAIYKMYPLEYFFTKV